MKHRFRAVRRAARLRFGETAAGPEIGAFVVLVMQYKLAPVGEWVLVIQGVIFVGCVLLFRRSIVGGWPESSIFAFKPDGLFGRFAALARFVFFPSTTRTFACGYATVEINERLPMATKRIFRALALAARFNELNHVAD
jgi:hypothetical protein